MHIFSFFLLLCLLLLFSKAGALFGYGLLRCQSTSPDDAVLLLQAYFNKVFLGQYNSTLGKCVGYTKTGKEIAVGLNKNPAFLRQVKRNIASCQNYASQLLDVFSQSVEPSVKVRPAEAAGGKHPASLVCSVYNFYPKQIIVTWLRNGKKVTSGVTSTEELPSGNWLYQMHSYLEYTPTAGEKITCMVDHISLKEPILYDWAPRSESETNKIAVGTAGLLLGLVVFVAGLIYYNKNNTGRVLVPTGYHLHFKPKRERIQLQNHQTKMAEHQTNTKIFMWRKSYSSP